jgi:GAF domain-containing protein
VYRFDGTLIHLAAYHNWTDEGLAFVRGLYPRAPSPETLMGATIMTRSVIQVRDFETDADLPAPLLLEPLRSIARAIGYRSQISVPMLREGNSIGAITVVRTEPGLFPTRQVELLKTFAAQAVIAIENARLFKELQEKNRALTESLEQQTATSEILRVISSSPTDVQPVFDAIAQRAMTLCEAQQGAVLKFDGELIHIVAVAHMLPGWAEIVHQAFPRRPGPGSASARAIMTRTIVHIPDVRTERHERLDVAPQLEEYRRSAICYTRSTAVKSEGGREENRWRLWLRCCGGRGPRRGRSLAPAFWCLSSMRLGAWDGGPLLSR